MNQRLFNENSLEELNERTAWVIGWIASDGCVTWKPPSIVMTLSETDIDVIKTIRSFFSHTGKLYCRPPSATNIYGTTKSAVGFQMGSKKLVSDLARFEIYPRKSGVQPFPKLILEAPETCIRGFVRGYFEGNGSIGWSSSKPKVSFCGSNSMMHVLSAKLSELCGIRAASVRVHSQCAKISEFEYKCHPALKVADWMYSGPGPFCRRKRDKYISIKASTMGRYLKGKWLGEKLDGPRPVKQINDSGRCVKRWPSLKDAAIGFNTSPGTIRRAADGRRQSALGFRWQYETAIPQT